MKNIIFVTAIGALLFASCTPLKRAKTGVTRAIAGSETTNVGGHEVYCSEGEVCAEIDVLAVSVEDRDGGRVRVTLKNRTDNTALIQIRLQIKNPTTGEVFSETRPENVAIPATQEKIYEMPGVFKKGAVVRVLLNTAY
ncbi:MAG TPA: hypothetical protein VEL47_05140 [Myxococcota bacterium]|nr:hypothetical protein [Myxococcota bacterium]